MTSSTTAFRTAWFHWWWTSFFSNLDITDWLSCFFKLHYFHLQKKKYFKYRDFPKYLLTSACYNTSNFLYLRTTISWLCTLCTWDEKKSIELLLFMIICTHVLLGEGFCAHVWRHHNGPRSWMAWTWVTGGCKPFSEGDGYWVSFGGSLSVPMMTYLSSTKGEKFLNVNIKMCELN